MNLQVKDIFTTMQGEGSRTGAPSVFIRLVGCNLWAGTPATRALGRGVCAGWCDTEFTGGTKMDPAQVVERVLSLVQGWGAPAVVVSGGEPCLHLRQPPGEALVQMLQKHRVHVSVETNGTLKTDVLAAVDHVTVSPKRLRSSKADLLAHVVVRTGADLKVVAPQWSLEDLQRMALWAFTHRFVQPLDDGGDPALAAGHALECAQELGWRVSVQTHKLVKMP